MKFKKVLTNLAEDVGERISPDSNEYWVCDLGKYARKKGFRFSNVKDPSIYKN